MFFWNSLALLKIQQMWEIWSLVPLAFLNPVWTSGSSRFMYRWSLALRILNNTLLACEMNEIVRQFEPSLALSFFEIGMKTDLFQSCGHCWVFQISCHITIFSFCYTTSLISHKYTYAPSLLSLPSYLFHPTHPGPHRALNWIPCFIQLLSTSYLFYTW